MNQFSNLDDSVIAEVMCYVTLDANHYKVRQFAATVLKAKSNPEINQILCHALQYERESSRPVTQALDALRVIGDPTTRDAIANFLNGFLSKWRMKGDTAISGMADAMAIGAHLDKEKSVCLGACRALAAFGNAEDISVLGSVLSDSYWGKYEEIRVELPKLIRQLEH
jgi:hypothetical protein